MDRDALWLWFTENFGFSNNKTNALLKKYNSPDGILNIPEMLLMESKDFTVKQKEEIIIRSFEPFKRKIKLLKAKGISVISIDNPLYPENLKNINNPPYVLYVKGNSESLKASYPITLVGTRNPDENGIKWAKEISYELSSMGAAVVSGLALGCDQLCHRGALDAKGTTIGVAACGLSVDYPSKSSGLKDEICKDGCIISEFPPDFPVRPQNFAIRNRILSGLSLAVIVIEGRLKSGTMLTANHALSQNRDVYVVAGDPFNPLSEGPLSLLNDGAYPFIESKAVISHYAEIYKKPLIIPSLNEDIKYNKSNIIYKQTEEKSECRNKFEKITDDLDDEQKSILLLLSKGPLQIDEMVVKLSLPSQRILSDLTELELFSYVKALPGGMYKALL